MHNVVIVGGGPAGIRAASILVEAGLKPILVNETKQAGGQGYRAPAKSLALDIKALMGSEAGKYQRLHTLFASLQERIDYRPGTLVWGTHEKVLHTLCDGVAGTIPYDALILATGATDRIMPLPGWTLPGVFTLGGAQVILKDQGCLIGNRVVFLGSSPLLFLAALQYHKSGASVAAVVDTTPLSAKRAAIRDLAASPRTLARGMLYRTALHMAGIPIIDGAAPLGIDGTDHVEGVRIKDRRGRERFIACDAVAYGYGLKPETQLAELAGARFQFDPDFRLWLPETDADGRAGADLYLAGDGAAIGGADAAEASGALAAYALLADTGRPQPESALAPLRKEIERLRRFQRGLAKAFAWPVEQAAALSDETIVCRCEAVTVGEIRAAVRAPLGPREVNRVKAVTRCGMGRCQGRFCGPALQEIVAGTCNAPIAQAGRLRVQAPVKPIPLHAAAELEP
ncbi:FAD-dependent oxidoreductase [Microvirga sp. ACRRW]|uniref:FAD/NAD(P)-dependent oxidoreductase n=1 Tax=Microvirga sp. ACRRW TaxID=2918205 RepID=UPI001EF55A4C|nr:NAD(P)/FAD-dependent oxidoreductase [Microvirga sp. ACRRW]MCG7391596.1 FAD-dependent oxidoreductase [Microvirga sp. ACRRW]